MLEWQAVDSVNGGRLVAERANATPNPVIEIVGLLPDGTEIKTVWAYLAVSGVAKLVTVHYTD